MERRQSGDDILAKGTPKVQPTKTKTHQSPSQQIQPSQNTQKRMSPKPRTGQSPSHTRKTNTLLDAFRPRSKSDAASKKNNTIMLQMKNSIQVSIIIIQEPYFVLRLLFMSMFFSSKFSKIAL